MKKTIGKGRHLARRGRCEAISPKLAIGAGYCRIEGFLRFDIDPKTAPDILGDAAQLTKAVKAGTVAEIRAHHILEHFFIKEAFPVLREWWAALKPGGRLEIAVPDCGYAAAAFTKGKIDAAQFVKILAGADQLANNWMVHKNFFTAGRLERDLMITGFVRIKSIRTKPDELKYEAYRPEDTNAHA